SMRRSDSISGPKPPRKSPLRSSRRSFASAVPVRVTILRSALSPAVCAANSDRIADANLSLPRIEAILLAAGESRRMGYPKPLLRVGAESFIARTTALALGVASRLVIVLGAHAERVRPAVAPDSRIIVVENPNFDRGQLSSLKVGLAGVIRLSSIAPCSPS